MIAVNYVATPSSSSTFAYIDTYTGTNTATLGAHQVGDLFVAWATRDGSSTAPGIPGGWSTIASSGTNSLGYSLVYKVSASTGETCGTFTNASSIVVDHIRPASGYSVAIGVTGTSASSSSTTGTFPAVTLQNTDDTSLLLAYLAHRSADVTVTTPPTGMVLNDYTLDATDAAASYRITAPASAWSQQIVELGGSAATVRTYMLEIKLTSGVPVNLPTSLAANVTGSDIAISWTDTNSGAAQHRIETSVDNTNWSLLTTKDAGTNSHTINSASPGTTYYRIRAQIGASNSSYTASVSATVEGSGGIWQLASGHYETAKIAMEIIAPRAGLTTANRYYKAYPGLLYRVPVSVLGGSWPFRYELTAAPSGMAIGETYGSANYGIITWTNPVTSGSPHTVTVRVTDQAGTVATVTYTITVTTTGFLFLDAVDGNDANPGTLASPKQTINGWYIARTDTTYQGYTVYYRTGTYRIDAADGGDVEWLACFANRKPDVHLGYPGETAIIDATTYGFCFSNSVAPTFCNLRGANVGPAPGGGSNWVWWDAAPDALMFENYIEATTGAGVVGSNASIFMSRNGDSSANYCSIINNTFAGLDAHDAFLGYDAYRGVFSGNTFANNDGPGCYLKNNNRYWSVRNNVGLNSSNTAELCQIDTYDTATDIEICWNNYRTSGHGIGTNQSGALGTIYDYRNTWNVGSNATENNASGTWNATRNVVLYDSGTQGYSVSSSGVTINRTELLAATTGLITEATGLLTGTDRTNYLGIRGHEVA